MRFALSIDEAPVTSSPEASRYRVLTSHGGNVQVQVSELATAIGRPLTALEDDWIDFLTAVHVADLICQRRPNENWNRHIRIGIPLRNPEPFQAAMPLVRLVFGRLTHDSLEIEFERRATMQVRYPAGAPRTTNADAVCLVSGGLDSAAAAIQLTRSGRTPIWVSARSSPHVRAAQQAVIGEAGGDAAAAFAVRLRHAHSTDPLPEIESSQRSRTLLYTGLAAMLAVSQGLRDVYLGENGVMAINCPLTAGRIGGFSTHTAHPSVLRLMETLFSQVFATDVVITNPLELLTKTEAIAQLARLAPAIAPDTHSCWNTRHALHCGTCVPCLVRRFGMIAAGQVDRQYAVDVFTTPIPVGDQRRDNLVDYLVFARKVESLTDDELLFEYSELNLAPPADIGEAIAMHRRWVRDVLGIARANPLLSPLV